MLKLEQLVKFLIGDMGEQLDEIYKDIDAWKARIKKLKMIIRRSNK